MSMMMEEKKEKEDMQREKSNNPNLKGGELSKRHDCSDTPKRESWGSLSNCSLGSMLRGKRAFACHSHFFINLILELNNRQPLPIAF